MLSQDNILHCVLHWCLPCALENLMTAYNIDSPTSDQDLLKSIFSKIQMLQELFLEYNFCTFPQVGVTNCWTSSDLYCPAFRHP